MSRGTSKAWVWGRALLLAPAVIALFGAVAGRAGHAVLPDDTLYGGDAAASLVTTLVLGYAGLAAYGFAALMLYALLFINGFRAAAGALRAWSAGLLAVLLLAWFALDQARTRLEGEIARTTTVEERVDAARWDARSCGRGRYLCVSWRGSLGRGGVKQYLGDSGRARAATIAWTELKSRGEPLTVSWGRTPSGWVAARHAAVSGHSAANPWF